MRFSDNGRIALATLEYVPEFEFLCIFALLSMVAVLCVCAENVWVFRKGFGELAMNV